MFSTVVTSGWGGMLSEFEAAVTFRAFLPDFAAAEAVVVDLVTLFVEF